MTDPRELLTVGCGAGTQSEAIFYLIRDGVVERPDHVIFADTGGEPAQVYAKLAHLRAGYESLGIPFHVVSRFQPVTDIHTDVLDPHVYATIPAFTVIERTVHVPLSWRRCTCDWARIFGIAGQKGTANLARFAPGTTPDEITHHHRVHITDTDCPLCTTGDEDTAPADTRTALLHLSEAGLHTVPAPHPECGNAGRIATRHHTYTKQERGRITRHCTGKYKIEPIERKIRVLLGAREWNEPCRWCQATGIRVPPWQPDAGEGPCSVCHGTGSRHRVGKAPKGSRVRHIIGFSADEYLMRVSEVGFPSHTTPVYPLAERNITRADCERLIRANGQNPVRSACNGCPNHGNAEWRDMKANRPDEWEQACRFDGAIRDVPAMHAKRYLHHSFTPLRHANLTKPSRQERKTAQHDLLQLLETGIGGCSPHGCRSHELDNHYPTLTTLPTPTFRNAA
ncbi:hypothetical protein FHS29_005018 [Saccharothrix tamanrassetensis]|uniref:Uncharacterized protein n=1 Tax=Saccharothrix tamanrassetensis TaxID=1051531 RepID=A0A841CMR0_9PSEU|nr:hypothetical protein [Saccharothrix tamanrassetensis]MBB5958410.1 hypothetical protein [Saccharothrix tamanrassetensis]